MKRKVLLLLTVATILLSGCGSATQSLGNESREDFMTKVGYCNDIEEWKDIETGVHYFIYKHKDGYGGMGGICPRYNPDGTLYVD